MAVRNLRNILVPVNFPFDSRNAIYSGVEMCRRHQAVLHLLYIREGTEPSAMNHRNAEISGLIYQAELENLAELTELTNKIASDERTPCYLHQLPFVSISGLIKKTHDLAIDLMILVQPHISGFLERITSGYTIYKIIKSLDCPVLSIPPNKDCLEFKKVLLPVRALPESLKKLDFALPILKKNQSEVLLFAPLERKDEAREISFVNVLLNRANYLLQMYDLDVSRETVIADDLASEVINKAVELNSDLIIITATIARGFSSLFNESYTEKVIRYSPVPVLSIKLDPEDENT
jgi:nucleotide-binding universal stress UspA family protein